MKRRSFLALGIAGFSGCGGLRASLGDSESAADTVTPAPVPEPTETDERRTGTERTRTSESTPTESETPTAEDTPLVVELETGPRTYAISPDSFPVGDAGEVSVGFEATATAEGPAVLSATLENVREFEQTLDVDGRLPFGRLQSRPPHAFGDEDATVAMAKQHRLVLAPTENHSLAETAPPVRRGRDGYWYLDTDVDQWFPETIHLDPGETVAGEYVVVGQSEGAYVDGRPPGVYRFGDGEQTLRIGVWETDSPGPTAASRFDGVSVPSLPENGETAWYHEADEFTSAYLLPSTEHARLPAQVEFSMVNKTLGLIGCGHWDLYKLVDGRWHHLLPQYHTSDCRILRTGDTHTWTLNAYHGEALPAIGDVHREGRNVGFLGGGVYAVATGYARDAVRTAALVELVGDPIDMEPTRDVESERSEDQVTVTRRTGEDDEHPPGTKLILTRVDTANERLIPEHVMRERNRGLRNTLPFVEDGVERVVLRTTERVAELTVGFGEGPRRFEFEGQAYEARIERKSM